MFELHIWIWLYYVLYQYHLGCGLLGDRLDSAEKRTRLLPMVTLLIALILLDLGVD